jgi:hypothetical protein
MNKITRAKPPLNGRLPVMQLSCVATIVATVVLEFQVQHCKITAPAVLVRGEQHTAKVASKYQAARYDKSRQFA